MSKLFDPQENAALLDAELEENATRSVPLPPAPDGVIAQIMELAFKDGIAGEKAKNPGKPWKRLDAKLEIRDTEYLAGYLDGTVEKVSRTVGIMLEMTDDGKIATGPNKNVNLGRFRAAADCNGKPLSALPGNFIKVIIINKPHPTDGEVVLDEITNYMKVE